MTPRDREIVGRGRTAEILAWGDGRVMKLYLAGSGREYVRREAEVSRLAHRAGLPAPAVYDSDAPDGGGGVWSCSPALGSGEER